MYKTPIDNGIYIYTQVPYQLVISGFLNHQQYHHPPFWMDLSLPTVDSPKFDASPWGDVWKDLPGTRPSMHFLVNKEIRPIETNRWVVKPKDERPTKGWNLKIQIGGRQFFPKKRGEKKSPPPPEKKKERKLKVGSDHLESTIKCEIFGIDYIEAIPNWRCQSA